MILYTYLYMVTEKGLGASFKVDTFDALHLGYTK